MRWLPFFAALLLLSGALAQGVTTATWQGTHDGVPLRVTVVARGHDIPTRVRQTEPWWRWGNLASDAYLFSFAEDGGVDLVLDFWPPPAQPGAVQATLYTLSGAARAGVRITPGTFEGYRLPAGVDPALSVASQRGGWRVRGRPTFDLVTRRFERYEDSLLEFHGRVGAAGPGVPAWARSRLMNDSHPHLGYTRFTATVRADESVPYELAAPLMPSWPYLSVTPTVFHWGPNRPLVFETSSGQLHEFWAGFHIAGSYQINSLSLPPHTDFEAPFAFYRFDPEAGRYANLVVRSDIWPAVSPFGPPIRGVPRTAMRMTWTERDPERWRYSLTVLGDHAMKGRVAVGGVRVRAVPYDALPSWVANKPWKVATFVEATHGQEGSEGIYDYTVEDNYPASFWAAGLRAGVPRSFTAPRLDARRIGPGRLAPGLRGEYGAVYNRVPRLYLSPIDRRVHLLHADGGVWNLGDAHVLRVANLDGDAHLDAWWRERVAPTRGPLRAENGVLEEALYRVDDLLFYTGPSGVTLRESAFGPAINTPPVPTDRSSWRAFLREAAPPRTPRDPWALAPWLEAFAGETLTLRGARLGGVQSSADEFRFVLELEPGASAEGTLALPFKRLPPGRYLVRYNRRTGGWQHERARPPKLSARLEPATLATFTPGTLELRLSNQGNLDLTAEAALTVGTKVVRRWDELRLEGGGALAVVIPWVPEQPGVWRATLTVGAARLPLGEVEVRPAPRVTKLEAFLLPTSGQTPFVALLGVAVLAGVGALWAAWRGA